MLVMTKVPREALLLETAVGKVCTLRHRTDVSQ